jgi:dTDP-4-amino-4,6-dideoxygalactose transaminase
MGDSAPMTAIPFARPALAEEDFREALDAVRSGWLTSGPRVKAFEAKFASWVGTPDAVALNSCTAALHLALVDAGIGNGDEVITTPLTFCSTVNVIVQVGATPVFADIDPLTQNLSPAACEAAITPRTRALVPVHYAGRPVDVRAFQALASRHGLALIEDAAHCCEGVSNAGKVGVTADYTAFSFYATKNLTTGEGGMLTLRDPVRAGDVRVAALHGMSRDAWGRYAGNGTPYYDVVMPGFKYNMTDLQAALGLHQLDRLTTQLRYRERLWARYDQGLSGLGLGLPAPPEPGTVHARHLYTVTVDEARCGWTREGLRSALQGMGIGTSVHFLPVHLFAYYRDRYGFQPGMFPHAEYAGAHVLSLPFSAGHTAEELDVVVDAVRSAVGPAASRRRS